MPKEIIRSNITVKDIPIATVRIDDRDFLSLTDLAKYRGSQDPSFTVKNWLRRVSTINFIGLWEQLQNPNFNLVEFDQIKNEYGVNSFTMSPTQWIRRTNAIGIISKGGRYSKGTFARTEIALEFASWLSPEFKLYVITEFERLKTSEAYQNKLEWHADRTLAKANYLIHTDAVKEYIIPQLTDEQKRFAYADEADLLNVALFGMTAKEWREQNPELAKISNIRDHTDLLHLIILSNLENLNAEFIKNGLAQNERLARLNNIARQQIEILKDNKSLQELERLQYSINSREMPQRDLIEGSEDV